MSSNFFDTSLKDGNVLATATKLKSVNNFVQIPVEFKDESENRIVKDCWFNLANIVCVFPAKYSPTTDRAAISCADGRHFVTDLSTVEIMQIIQPED